MAETTSESTPERTTHYRTCPLCEATCGLEVTMEGESVLRIRGDRDDVFSHGFICPKGSTLKHLHEDPDRLRVPLVKRDGVHVEVTWDEAFVEVERLVTPVLEQHGRESAAIYLGNPNVHNHALTIYGRSLIMALHDAGRTILLIEHVLPLLTSVSDRLIVLDQGSVISEGTPQQVIADPRVVEAYLGGAT